MTTRNSYIPRYQFAYFFILIIAAMSYADMAIAGDMHRGNGIRALLIPQSETIFSSEISASIQEISVDFGDRFKKGQKLIEFDCGMYRADLKKAKAELTETMKTHEVNSKLEEHLSISELEVAISEARSDRAKAEVELKEAMVSKCQILAPFAGRVVKRASNPFQYVVQGQPLLEVIDDILLVQLFVPSNWINRMRTGLEFQIHIDETGSDYKARIIALGAKADQVSQTIELRAIIIESYPDLLAGMSGTAYF